MHINSLIGKVAIVTGATRGIGRDVALGLAQKGCDVVVAGKSITDTEKLPGTIYSVAEQVRHFGNKCLAFQLDLRDENQIKECVDKTINTFGKVDILINNASAMFWQPITTTPVKKYDLINNINSRGTFLMIAACLPHMARQNYGRIINMSPPIELDKIGGKTAYCISKYGMSMSALGVAQEYQNANMNITANCLWPKTIIKSYASINHNIGNEKMWRTPEILTDAVFQILLENSKFTGNMLIDELYLRSKGVTDFSKYQCVTGYEPPAMADLKSSDMMSFTKKIGLYFKTKF